MPIAPDPSPAFDQDDEDTDSCLCGMAHVDDDVTPDQELPDACGGIEIEDGKEPDDDEDDVDGCALDFSADDLTTDAELPVTVGGQ